MTERPSAKGKPPRAPVVHVVPAPPGPCSRCREKHSDSTRRQWGCGWLPKAAGRGTDPQLARYAAEFIDDVESLTLDFIDSQPDEYRTCPWFYDAQPFVGSIFELLEDYEKGRLGDVRNMPAPWADYLRVASDARARWRKFWQDETS